MAITDAQAATINNAMAANQRVSLGTIVQGLQTSVASMNLVRGSHAVTAGEATAETLDIDTGDATLVTGFMVQIYRSDVDVKLDAEVSLDAGVLTVASGASTYTMAEGDVINYIVF